MTEEIKKLLGRITDDPSLTGAVDKVFPVGFRKDSSLHLNIHGMCEEQKGYIACAVADHLGKKPVIIAPDIARARSLSRSVVPFVDGEVIILPPSMLTLVTAVASSRDDDTSRMDALSKLVSGRFGAAVITAPSLINKLPSPDDVRKHSVHLKLGDIKDPSDLSMELSEIGYERVQMTGGRGEFSWRGDIIDIFPPDSDMPVRISFFDDEVDQIKTFDIESQRSVDSLTCIDICPDSELLISADDREKVAGIIKKRADDDIAKMAHTTTAMKVARLLSETAGKDIESVRNGIRLSGFAKWLSCIITEPSCVLDYIGDDCLIFASEFSESDTRIKAYASEYAMRCQEFFEVGMAPSSARDAVFDKNLIYKKIDRSNVITLSCFGSGLPGALNCSVTGFPQESFNGRYKDLAEIIRRDGMRDEKRVYLFLQPGDRLDRFRSSMAELDCFPVIQDKALGTGFTYPVIGISLYGEQDIYGLDRITKPKKKGSARLTFIGECEPGDYVVHDQHGIGRYEGIENVRTGTTSKDYLKISYAGGEILYVAPENMDCLQKYVGPGDKEPKLSKLGGDDWAKKVNKARNQVKKTAYDLLKLYASRSAVKGFSHLPDTDEQMEFEQSFPYVETEDQLRAIAEVKRDMQSDRPMDRLLCGDVGFGKTEVAMRAMFKCVMSGKQAVLIAPTTLLAQQHYDTFRKRIGSFPINIVLLSRFVSAKKLKENLALIKSGKADIIIGTHRALSDDVVPKNLGLLVIDEEQRFGVNHKEKIKVLRQNLDVLALSATPIPRTLHMSLTGIRDISMLEEAPVNRRPVQTFVMEYDDEIVTQACMREIGRGGQVFYLHNNTRNIDATAARLSELMPDVRIIYAHGKMNEQELEQIVVDFAAGKYDILVCTTIIENGVDMPNVNTLIVENSDRFGLAQLYQIKGRVGRSDRQAYAYFTFEPEKILKEDAVKRLSAIKEFTELGSGVKIAMRDLEVRGAGSLLGADQHGMMDAIGYELYCRMLDEEIARLRNEGDETFAVRKESAVDVDFDSYIPRGYIEHESERMVIYRRISAISTKEEYDDFLDEVTDRFGDPPRQINILAGVSLIRHMSADLGFAKIVIRNPGVRFIFEEGRPLDMQAISALMSDEKLSGRIRIDASGSPELVYKPVSVQNERTTEEIIRILCILKDNRSES